MNWLNERVTGFKYVTSPCIKRTNKQSNKKKEDVLLLRGRRNVQRQHLQRLLPSDQRVRVVEAEPWLQGTVVLEKVLLVVGVQLFVL